MKKLLTSVAISALTLCGISTLAKALIKVTAITSGAAISTAIALTTQCSATAKGKIIPIAEWWHSIRYSPDGNKVALITPPPPWFEKNNNPKGKAYNRQLNAPKKLVILNAKDFSLIAEIDYNARPTWSPNSKYIGVNDFKTMSTSPRRFLELGIYEANSGAKLLCINDAPAGAYAWSPDSQRLFLTRRESLSIFDIEKKEETLLPFKTGENDFQRPQWSPDGKLIAASLSTNANGEQSKVIRIWNANSKDVDAEIKLKDGIRMLAWSPNGKLLIYSEPQAIQVLDAVSKKTISTIETKEKEAIGFGWSHDKTKFSYRDRGVLHILDATIMKETARIVGPPAEYLDRGWYINTEWSPDDKFILISCQHTAAICDAQSGQYLGYKTWPDATVKTISPDQKLLIIQSASSPTVSEPLELPPAQGSSPFRNGKIGTPSWN